MRRLCVNSDNPSCPGLPASRTAKRLPRSMNSHSRSLHVTHRLLWIRRGVSPIPYASGEPCALPLSELGIAAARETFLTATVPFAAAWTDLFREMLADCPELRWRESGPGIGRDARIAYSSLFGRYMARAYLTACEGVRVLIPLDDAKLALRGTSYSVDKLPSEQGLQADWIGLDQHRRLVIAEAKGSLDRGVRT